MSRTWQRPLPAGHLTSREAAAFAATTGASGLVLLSVGATPLAAAVAGTTMVTYVAMYTPMKVRSPYNTHIGAVSGSLPTLLGFAAALGGGLAASPWAPHAVWLFAMQTLWQMPHFYALAWLHRADYIRGGYQMFPLADATGHGTAAMAKPYLAVLTALPCAASAAGLASWMLPVGAALPTVLWWRSLLEFEAKPGPATCRRFFLDSLSYLLATLALFTAFAKAEAPAAPPAAPAAAECDRPECRDGGCSCGQAAAERPSALEPAWRAALHARFSELCPHETARQAIVGLVTRSCPFGKDP